MDFSSHSCTYRLLLYNRSAWADVSLFHIFKGGKKTKTFASGYRGALMKLINNHSDFLHWIQQLIWGDVCVQMPAWWRSSGPALLHKAPSDQIHSSRPNVMPSCSDLPGTGSDTADLLLFGSRNREVQANNTQTTRTRMLNTDLKVAWWVLLKDFVTFCAAYTRLWFIEDELTL